MMINLARVVRDSRFASAFTVRRATGSFDADGDFVLGAEQVLDRFGVVQPSKTDDLLKFLPEGERQGNFITIYCDQDVLMGNGKDRQSDVVVWRGDYYRVAFSKPWDIHGYWFAIAQGFVHG